jgi:hypothetical protein
MNAQLLGGLLLDGIDAAVMRKQEVFQRLLPACSGADAKDGLKNTLAVLQACREKTDGDWKALNAAAHSVTPTPKDEEGRTRLRLTLLAIGMPLKATWDLCGSGSKREAALLALFTGKTLTSADAKILSYNLRPLWIGSDAALLSSPWGNFLAAIFQSVAERVGPQSG